MRTALTILFAATWLAAGRADAAATAEKPQPPQTQVYVAVQPDGASVSIDGKQVDAPPVVISGLAPGKHLLRVTKMGCDEELRTIEVHPEQRLNIEIPLRPVMGLVLVHSKPDGVAVEIDGAYRGDTPLLIGDLPVGKYRAKLHRPGYLTKEIDLLIDKRNPKRFFVELTSSSATLVIASQPTGARVNVNGISRGVTPCTVEQIPEGDASVEILQDGHQPHKQTVRLVAGQEQKIEAVLAPIPASLTVVTIPPKARIYIDNQFRGESPVKLGEIKPGSYRIRAERDGFEAQARTVDLALAQTLVEEFRLVGNTGMMELTTEPAQVTVFVDGKEAGITIAKPGQTDNVSDPLRIDGLDVGRHSVQLSRTGFFGDTIPVDIERGKTATLHRKLGKRFIPNCEVVTKVAVYRGVLLDLSPAGDVKMEVSPGVIRSIPVSEIRFRRPIREEAP